MNINRLFQVMKWNDIAQRKQLFRVMIGLCVAYFIITGLSAGFFWKTGDLYEGKIEAAAVFCCMVTAGVLLFAASQICYNMKTKTDYINYAMIPATTLEKYISNVLTVVIMHFVVAIVALLAADAMQYVVSYIRFDHAYSLTHRVYNVIFHFNPSTQVDTQIETTLWFGVVGIFLFIHSSFVMLGCLYRKHSFISSIMTWVVVPVSIVAICFGFSNLIESILVSNDSSLYVKPLFSDHVNDILGSILVYSLISLCYYLGYRFFSRSQVINNRWIN